MRLPWNWTAAAVGCCCACVLPARAQTQVFFSDFDSSSVIPAQFSAAGAHVEAVQGFGGLGPAGNPFAGSFLRYSDQAIVPVELTLTNLPAHTGLNLGFLLAVIDSWDDTELLNISVDNTELFSNRFQLAVGDTSSYTPVSGGLLSSGTNLGFSNGSYYMHDRAYDMNREPRFNNIPHTASSVTIRWTLGAVSGSAAEQWQGGDDESWAIDNVRVSVLRLGDFNNDSVLNAPDVDALFAAQPGPNVVANAGFDLNRDGVVSLTPGALDSDVDVWVRDIVQTRYGDANLDRHVDFSDLLQLAKHFGAPSGGWSDGNFDGVSGVAFNDLLLLAKNYGFGSANTSAADFTSDWALAQALVPEPASLATMFTLVVAASPKRFARRARHHAA